METCPKCGKNIFLASRFVTMFDVDEEDQEECGMAEVSEEADICIHFCEEHGIIDIWIEEPADMWRKEWGVLPTPPNNGMEPDQKDISRQRIKT